MWKEFELVQEKPLRHMNRRLSGCCDFDFINLYQVSTVHCMSYDVSRALCRDGRDDHVMIVSWRCIQITRRDLHEQSHLAIETMGTEYVSAG